MTFKHVSELNVYYLDGLSKVRMGQLALKERKIFFEYDEKFLKTKLELSPFKLPLKAGISMCEDRVFEGLFGVFNDSLPDGWGRLLLDRKLMKAGIHLGELSPLDRLSYIGNHSLGALQYEPQIEEHFLSYNKNFDDIAYEIIQFQEHDDDRFVEDLIAMNGSSAGARPKAILRIGEEDWIVKFRSIFDPKDIGPIEYAYHLMAKSALLEVPFAKLFPSQKGFGYFGVKRFDRVNGHPVHLHSLSGLYHIDHRIPSLDYETILKITGWLTKDIKEVKKQFKAVVFNVLAHNRDDHAKNFSFLMDAQGVWKVSPAYDLTFSFGPGHEHCTTIMGEGKNPTLSHLLKLADIVGITKQEALEIIESIKEVVSAWKIFAKEAGLSTSSLNRIQKSLESVMKNGQF